MPIATMTNKGQITIPKEVRDMLGLHSGDKLEFSCVKDGKLLVTPLKKNVDDLYGKLFNPDTKPLSIEAINEAIRSKFQQESCE
ncbi:MAG: AbrB/MazE/SpoVT family DNA-binding domain-containing protein [Chlorobiaceae bacterium]|nr:AbrB/MazE/SpoVT family DNA-binding domain-containing protein [Chlorobiaceae bacterium]